VLTPRAVGLLPVCLTVKPVGKPNAGDRHVRFDERGWETECWPQAPSYRAHPRLYLSRHFDDAHECPLLGVSGLTMRGLGHSSVWIASPSENFMENGVAGFGSLADSYCNSMKCFQRVRSRNPLNFFSCRIPSTGTSLRSRSNGWRARSAEISRKYATMKQPIVSRDYDVMGGAPVFSGTRVLVRTLLDYLEAGESIDDFLEGFPSVTRDQAIAFLKAKHE
jgi:uncharacterized protein (DUF433 family)